MKTLIEVEIRCFMLIKIFISLRKHDLKKNAESNIIIDNNHRFAQLSLCDFRFNSYFQIDSNVKLMRFSSRHSFIRQLMSAYELDYDIRIVNLRINKLK